MRRTGIPNIVTSQGAHYLLSRVHFSDRRIAEDFLQTSLHQTPTILPIEEIDPSFGPVASLGREITAIDNLFISPTGKLTLVETKLWRNPEATRTVVAQVLDYATRLSSWSYSDLEEAARHALSPAPIGDGSLYEFVVRAFPDEVLPEIQFVDEVQRNLRDARFLLLVVGDGIRENLENILEHLHRQPQMLYKFCLVEVHIFENPDVFDGRILMPMVVANTTEIVRAVVRVQTTGQAQVTVAIEEQNDVKSGGSRRKLSEELFFDEVKEDEVRKLFRQLLSFAYEIGAEPAWRSSAVSIQLPDPQGSRQNFTLFVMATRGEVYLGWLAGQLERVSLDKNIGLGFVERLASLFPGVTPHSKNPETLSRPLRASELAPKVDAFMSIVRETVVKIKEL
ncbi:MAG: hypothetical protein AB7D27_02880 [Desulfomicrobium sp.]